MKDCPGCRKSIADILGQCPFCRHIFPAAEGKPTLDPALIQAALAAERPVSRGDFGFIQAALLVLALPVLVPSLIWFWIGAKRWGRVDWILLAVSGGVLTLFATSSTTLFVLMLLADAAATALFILRYQYLDRGIFLGFSDSVATCLIWGGILTGGALCLGLPFGALVQLSNLYGFEGTLTPPDLTSNLPAAPRPVRLENAAFAEDQVWLEFGLKDRPFTRRGASASTGITTSTAPNAPDDAPAYAQLKNTEGKAWVHFPTGYPSPAPAAIHGILTPTSPAPAFAAFQRQATPGEGARDVHIITATDRPTYLRTSGLGQRLRDGFSIGGLAALALGSLLLFFGVWFAARE